MIMIVATVLPSLNMKEEYAIARAMIKNRKLSDDLKSTLSLPPENIKNPKVF